MELYQQAISFACAGFVFPPGRAEQPQIRLRHRHQHLACATPTHLEADQYTLADRRLIIVLGLVYGATVLPDATALTHGLWVCLLVVLKTGLRVLNSCSLKHLMLDPD